MSYKWEMNMHNGYYTLFVKVDNLSNSFIEATTTLTLFSPKGTHLLINGDKVYEANSCVEIGVDFPSHVLSSSGWTGATKADLRCELTILESTPSDSDAQAQIDLQITKKYQKDLGKTFLDKDHSDIKVICGEKIYDCHKVILSARSRYFKTLLSWNGSETDERMIEIVDFDCAVIFQVLQYIYTGTLDNTANSEDMASEILKAANKYELEALKALCEKKLVDVLKDENCLRIYILSDFHQAFVLKKEALEIINSNWEAVFKSEDWEMCVRDHPGLAVEINRALVKDK